MKREFVVQNLKCGGCANSISKALLQLKNVHSVEVNTAESIVLVDLNEDIDNAVIAEKLANIGYPLVGADASALQQVNAYISCIRGKFN